MLKHIIFLTLLFLIVATAKANENDIISKSNNNIENLNFKLTPKEREFIQKNIINISYTNNWTPLSFENKNQADGLGFDFWKYIAKKNNIMYEVNLEKNFSNALNSIKNKTTDIILTTANTKDRKNYAIFSDTYFSAPIGIATLQNKNFIPNIEAIKDKKIAIGKNYSAYKILKEIYPYLNFVFIDNLADGLEKLSNNQVDALIDIMPVLSHNIEKLGYTNVKISGTTGVIFDLNMMIRDDYTLLQSIINKTLLTMDIEEKNRIYKKWSELKYQKEFDYSFLLKIFLPLLLIVLIIILYKNRELTTYQKKLKTTKNDLENSLKSFKTLVDLAIEGIAIIENKKIVFVNNQMCQMFDLEKEELIGKDILDFFEKDTQNILKNSITNNDSKNIELNGIKKSKKLFPCIIKSKNSIINNSSSNIISIVDISQIKEKENILLNQSKMASLGEMIANIAHQWRQPLSFISTASSGLKIQSEYGNISNKEMLLTLDSITETTQFLSQTIDDFQDYLKKDKVKKEFFVDETIEKVLSILRGNYKQHAITIINKTNKGCKAFGHQNELKQVLLNILNNSKDALKNINGKRYIEIKYHNKNKFTYIDIIDNGGGIKESIIDKIFEPYFTTKFKKQGTGLGLYMTHKIINDSLNGTIKIINCKHTFENIIYDKSTKVSIKLPIS